ATGAIGRQRRDLLRQLPPDVAKGLLGLRAERAPRAGTLPPVDEALEPGLVDAERIRPVGAELPDRLARRGVPGRVEEPERDRLVDRDPPHGVRPRERELQ